VSARGADRPSDGELVVDRLAQLCHLVVGQGRERTCRVLTSASFSSLRGGSRSRCRRCRSGRPRRACSAGMLMPCDSRHGYPCRCLCRRVWSRSTSTAPWRRTILHFSHIGLTDGRTFMGPFRMESGGVALAAVAATATHGARTYLRQKIALPGSAPTNNSSEMGAVGGQPRAVLMAAARLPSAVPRSEDAGAPSASMAMVNSEMGRQRAIPARRSPSGRRPSARHGGPR